MMEYIDQWCTLSLSCKDKLSKPFSIEMCIQEMHWKLSYILQGVQPKTFEKSKAHDLELNIANHGMIVPIKGRWKEKNTNKNKKFHNLSAKESMLVETTSIKGEGNAKSQEQSTFEERHLSLRVGKA